MKNYLYFCDLEINNLLKITLSLELAMVGLIGSDILGLEIPLLRQIIGFIYLAFIPGALILRILKLHYLDLIESVLFSVGLSISFVMFMGFFLNSLSIILRFEKPLSLQLLVIALSIGLLLLSAFSYLRDKDFTIPRSQDAENKGVHWFHFLYLIIISLPLLSVFATLLVNYYDNYVAIYILLIILSAIPLVICFNLSEKFYALTVFIAAISILFHWSLITQYLSGGDIHYEFYFANLATSNSYWDPTINNSLNGMLSVVMLAPIFSIFCNISIIWVFKIIYPIIFALIPLGLYNVYKKQIDVKLSILSVFYFMFVFPFFSEMLQLARQEIAELYLTLIIIILVNKNIAQNIKSLLLLIFSISLIASHYGLSYLFMLSLILGLITFSLVNIKYIKTLLAKFVHNKVSVTEQYFLNEDHEYPSQIFVLFYIIFALTWYIYIASSNSFVTIVDIGDHILSQIYQEFLSPETSQGVSLLIYKPSRLHEITKYLYIFSQIMILLGILRTIILNLFRNDKYINFYIGFKIFSVVNLFLLVLALILPNFAKALNTTRIYHITLFFLAPFCVIGVITTFELINAVLIKFKCRFVFSKEVQIKAFGLFLLIFLLFTSGFAYELGHDDPVSIALNSTFDFPRYNDEEVFAAKWIANKINEFRINADPFGKYLLVEYILPNIGFDWETAKSGYLYLRKTNIKTDRMLFYVREKTLAHERYINLSDLTYYNKASTIYANGGGTLLYYHRT